MKTLEEWLISAGQIHSKTIDLGLARIKAVAKKMGLLDWRCPVITVAGTNGKGSTITLLETIYHQAGYKTGCLTSPDLLRYNERIRINQEEANNETICQAFATVERLRENITLTFFEFNVLVALVIFKEQLLDVILLEVGLGGRLDACNIIDPDLAIITSIALDHMDFLGNTRESIASEKAGILRQNIPAIIGEPDPPTSLMKAIETQTVKAFFLHKDFNFTENKNNWSWQSRNKTYLTLPKPNILLQNAATALAAIETMQSLLPINLKAIRNGLSTVFVPGRFEMTTYQGKKILFDVAHNPAACAALADNLKKHFPNEKFSAVFSMLKNKDISTCLNQLKPFIDHWHIAPVTHERATQISGLKDACKKVQIEPASFHPTLESAFTSAIRSEDTLLIFGSFVTVANIKRLLRPKQ